jgi:hypothetical protein
LRQPGTLPCLPQVPGERLEERRPQGTGHPAAFAPGRSEGLETIVCDRL